jgi:hypothetical protein
VLQVKGKVNLFLHLGRAIAQAVSRWLPTAAARVRVRAACGVCGGQSGTGAGFFRVLRFLLPIILPISPSSKSPGAGTVGLLVAAVPSEFNWTPHPTIPIKKNVLFLHLITYLTTMPSGRHSDVQR